MFNINESTEFEIVWKKGVPHAVPAKQQPTTKRKIKVESNVTVADVMQEVEKENKYSGLLGDYKLVTTKRTKLKGTKTPKMVEQWRDIREQIRAGVALKEIATNFNVRYYDVYRVKCWAMDIE